MFIYVRKLFIHEDFLKNTIFWPPKMIDSVLKLAEAVGDIERTKALVAGGSSQ